jgi:hypothetical protein
MKPITVCKEYEIGIDFPDYIEGGSGRYGEKR